MKLYHCPHSRSLRVIWLAEEIGVEVEVQPVAFPPRLREPSFLDINPTGLIPTLDVDGARMTESMAICDYLAGRHGGDLLRVTSDEADRRAYLEYLHMGEATLIPQLTQIVRYGMYEPKDRRLPQAAQDGMEGYLDRLQLVEDRLEGREYVAADRFTLADISIGYAVHLGDFLRPGPKMGPRCQAYLQRLHDRPAFQRALARN